MQDELAIQRQISLFTESTGRRDWALAISTFLPDAVWEVTHPPDRCAGHVDMLEMFQKISGQFAYLVQVNAPAIIAIDGDRATARSAIREAGRFKDRDEVLDLFGTYEDKLVRTPQGWRFSHRLFRTIGLYRLQVLPEAG